MPPVPISVDRVQVVIKGNFPPPLLSPAWLLYEQIIGQTEYDQADVTLISPEATQFNCDWLSVQVMTDSLTLATGVEDEFERLRDAAIAILRALPTTEIAAMGINRVVHIDMGSGQALHRIGDALAPKAVWDEVLEFAATRSITTWGYRGGDAAGLIHVTVEPSVQVSNGVYVLHNDHYELAPREHEAASRDDAFQSLSVDLPLSVEKLPVAIGLLSDDWDASMRRAEAAYKHIYQLGQEG